MTNAYQRVTISVTQDHIDKGIKLSPCNCPIALAIKGQLKTTGCTVGGDYNEFLLKSLSQWVVFELADAGKDFILKFDEGKPVQPFDFSIFIPLNQWFTDQKTI